MNTDKTRYSAMSQDDLLLRLAMYEAIDHGWLNNLGIPALDLTGKINNKLLNSVSDAALIETAIKVFFGGPDLKGTAETASANLASGVGAIIDFSASENNTSSDPSVFNAVRDEYLRGIHKAAKLNSEQNISGNNPAGASVAIKLSTLAPFEALKKLSTLLENESLSEDETMYRDFTLRQIEERTNAIFTYAQKHNVRIYVDAEQSSINPAIRKVCTNALDHGYDFAMTIQGYLKETPTLIDDILQWNRCPDIKLVRGAYIGDPVERPLIWDTKAQTDKCYDEALMRLYQSGRIGHITVATHNTDSQKVAQELSHTNSSQTTLSLAKLRGLGDSTLHTLTLPVEEYLPYPGLDHIRDAIAYLGRRGIEMMGVVKEGEPSRARQEVDAIRTELSSRNLSKADLALSWAALVKHGVGSAVSRTMERKRENAELQWRI